MTVFFTVGHSTKTLDELIELVGTGGTWPLVDVRSFPGSRKFPHFNKENLEHELGIAYRHLPELGGYRKAVDISLNGAWEHPSFRSYADYMQTDEFAEGLAALEDIGECTFMCSESLWWRCHRRMISDALVVNGHEVIHLPFNGRHELTEFAVTEPYLHYPARDAEGDEALAL